jgi:hypothetical protein
MRKVLIALLVAAISLSVALSLVGCGADKNKEEAKKAMAAGDEYMDAARAQMDQLEEKQQEMTAAVMSGDTSVLAQAVGEEAKVANAAILAALEADFDSAEKAYAEILNMEGVQDYKDYANKMIEAIAMYRQWEQAAEKLLESVSQMVASLLPGQALDVTKLANMPEVQEIQTSMDKAKKLVKEADSIKSEKKL